MSKGQWIVVAHRIARPIWTTEPIDNIKDAMDVADEWFQKLSQIGGSFTVQIARVEEVFGVAASAG